MIFQEHLGVSCPVCGDTMTEHSNYSPTWSDHHDDIVCWDCFGKLVKCDSCGCDIAPTGFCRVDDGTESVKTAVGTCDRCASEWDRAAGAVVALDDDPEDESVQNQAVELADKIALDQYGFSPLSVCNETVVECCGVTR